MSEAMHEFALVRPNSIDEAIKAAGGSLPSRYLAGGTDLIVNMRRGLVVEEQLIDLTGIRELKQLSFDEAGLHIGSGVTLRKVAENKDISENYRAITQACEAVAGPGHRAAATAGGNLCLDTRCLYYNQSHWWRGANNFCLKFKGDTCHVAPTGNRCRAAFSGDLAPALMVHEAEVEIAGPNTRRRIALADLYNEDGANHLHLSPGEILVAVHVPPPGAYGLEKSAYGKVRTRSAIDFPLAGIALSCSRSADGALHFKAAVTGTNSRPFLIEGF
ncbi:MAG: FAD binding domain-containing protein, partial [Hyphomicrobiales bacterium]